MATTYRADSQQGRLPQLDSLRGLAALVVVFHHFGNLWEKDSLQDSFGSNGFLLYRFFTPGRESVVLFFILSGFVLALPAIKGKAQSYSVFLARRIFRIYLPYLAALALAVAGAYWLHGLLPLSVWFGKTWSQPVDWHLVLQHVLFLGSYNDAQFNTAFWSLIVEMRVSLIFPFLCAGILRLRSAWSLTIALALPFACAWISLHVHAPSLLATASFTALFILGILLASHQQAIHRFYTQLPRKVRIASAFAALPFFSFGAATVRTLGKNHGIDLDMPADLVTALAAGWMIVLSLNSQLCRRFLLAQPVHYFGVVSYSMYLMHGTVLFALVHLLYQRIPLPAILPIYLAGVLLVTALFYHTVEKPSMDAGRRVSNLLFQ